MIFEVKHILCITSLFKTENENKNLARKKIHFWEVLLHMKVDYNTLNFNSPEYNMNI